MNLPRPDVIDECPSLGELPYFLVGDEAFPLQLWLLRPYPGHGLTEGQMYPERHGERIWYIGISMENFSSTYTN